MAGSDATRQALLDIGYSGALPDMLKNYLGDIGYNQSISLTDRMAKWDKVVKPLSAYASLFLDFANNVYEVKDKDTNLVDRSGFGNIITFTRASSGGRFNSSGLYETVATNVPRLDYDPVTLQPKGLLIEEQRTNLLTYSSDFSNAAWTKLGVTAVANAAVSPDGNSNATLLRETTGTGEHAVYRFLTLSANTHATTAYYKSAGVGYIQVSTNATPAGASESAFINLSSGAVSSSSFGDRLTVRVLANGWVEVRYTATNGVTGSQRNALYTLLSKDGVSTTYTGDGTSGIYIWGAQLEAGAFPTSYIPTVASQVTRSADVASVNTLSPWYNASEGTLFVDIGSVPVAGGRFVTLSDGTINNQIFLSNGAVEAFSGYTGVFQWQIAQPIGAGKLAGAYAVNNIAVSKNGGAVSTDTTASIPAVTTMSIGKSWNNATFFNGHIRSLEYYPVRHSNEALVGETK